MSIISDIRNRHESILRVALFVMAGLLLLAMLPKGGKFKYEYQKGRPWMHEDLVAPFDFAIEKSAEELNAENEKIINGAKIYLRRDSSARSTVLTALRADLDRQFGPGSNKDDGQLTFDRYLKAGESIVDSIYVNGVLRMSKELDGLAEDRSIFVLDGNVSTETVLGRILTLTEAQGLIVRSTKRIPHVNSKILSSSLYAALIQNVFFDKDATDRALKEELDMVSSTRGMIPSGLKVISRGDMVDNENFLVLESMRKTYESKLGSSGSFYLVLLGQFVMVLLVLLMFYLFLSRFQQEIFSNNWHIIFLLLMILLMVFIASSVLKIDNINLYLVPFCLLPVIVHSFFDSRTALFAHLMTLVVIGFEAPNGFEFIFLQLTAGIVSIITLISLQSRSQMFISMFIVFLTYSASYFCMAAMQEGDINGIDIGMFAWFGGSVGLTLLAYPLIYVFEKMFGFVSEVTLLELSNTNNTLLRKLASEAPGTFQHSLQVATLAESAVYEVGGNALLIRTGAMYHDIGKLHAPMYFIENQVTGVNPHDELSFEESAKIIIGHVIKGVELAKKHNLPEQLIDFIRTHHGTSTVQYFYRSYLNNFPEGDLERENFSYPGPKPFTKEMAILMMADSVEAASRSLKTYTAETVANLVDSIIDHQFSEGQFDNADITLRNIEQARAVFKKRLLNIYHVRIEYPT